MSDVTGWDEHYRKGETPWDTGRPSAELQRVVAEHGVRPCRAVELGCGTGVNAVWLAQQGFEVTGLDLSPLAVEQARRRAAEAGVAVRFEAADVLAPPDLGPPFDFFFDRGCYHIVRRENADGYLATLVRLTRPGALGLILTGNAREPLTPGPPVMSEADLQAELGRHFTLVDLHEFRFDQPPGWEVRPLAWSCLLRKAA